MNLDNAHRYLEAAAQKQTVDSCQTFSLLAIAEALVAIAEHLERTKA